MKVLAYSESYFTSYPDCPRQVPMHLLNEEYAQRIHGQSLARLNERGGMSPCEMVANIERRRWKPMTEEAAIAQLNRYIANGGTN